MNTQTNERHGWTQERLDAYVADGLTPEERTGVDQHVAECPDCREVLRTLVQMDQKMQGLFADARPAEDFEQRIITHLWQATWRMRFSTPTMKRVRYAIAASLLLASGGIVANYAVDNNILSNPISGQLADSGHGFEPDWMKENPFSSRERSGDRAASDYKNALSITMPEARPQDKISNYTDRDKAISEHQDSLWNMLPYSSAGGERYRYSARIVDTNRFTNLNSGNPALPQYQKQYYTTYSLDRNQDGSQNVTTKFLTQDYVRSDLKASVTALTTANQAMTNTLGKLNSDLAGLHKEVPVLSGRNSELNRNNNELQVQMEKDTNAIRRLQVEVANAQAPFAGEQITDRPKITLNNGQKTFSSPNHNGDGQNLAYGDFHVDWRNSPDTGRIGGSGGEDNIYANGGGGKDGSTNMKMAKRTPEITATSNTISGAISGSGSLAFNGGTASTGETTIQNGTLQTGNGASLGVTDNSSLVVTGGITGTGTSSAYRLYGKTGTLHESSNFGMKQLGWGMTDTSGGVIDNHRNSTIATLSTTSEIQKLVQEGKTAPKSYISKSDVSILTEKGKPIETVAVKPLATTVTVPDGGTSMNGGQELLAPATPPPATQPTPTAQATVTTQKIIRTGTMEFEVRSFDDASDTINKVVTEEGGFVAGTNSEKLANGKVKGTITVRVDPARLDRVVLKLRGLGDLKTQQIAAQDITKEYTDIESELRANRSMEERMLDIIKNGKGSIKDLVEAEKQLGVYRERIEKTEGEKRYYDNLVGLSTLSITCYEKDIAAAANAAEQENVVMSVETEDVENKFSQAKEAIEKDAGGRIIKAELRRFEASQLAAQIVCEVPADKADLLVVRFKQLGKVAGLDRLRSQSTPNGQSAPLANAKVEQKNTQVSLSLYNLANIAPRQTAVLVVAVPNVQDAYESVLHRVRQDAQPPAGEKVSDTVSKPAGVVATSNITGQQPEQMNADIRADVRTVEAPAVLAAIRGLGEVMSSTITENPDTANVTASKQGIQLRLVAIAAVPSRDTQTLQIAAADVPAAYTKMLDALRPLEGEKGGRILTAQLNQQDAHNVTATLDVELRRTDQGFFDAALAATGSQIVARNVARSTDAANTLDTKVRYTITLAAADSLPPRESAAIGMEVDDVERGLSDLRATIAADNGHELDASKSKDAGGHVIARILIDVPLANSPDLLAKLQALGKERTNDNARNPQAVDGKLARARYDITLSNTAGLVPQDKTIGSTLHAAVSASLAVLLWSLYLIVQGLLVVGPWLAMGWLAWRLLKRKKAAAQ